MRKLLLITLLAVGLVSFYAGYSFADEVKEYVSNTVSVGSWMGMILYESDGKTKILSNSDRDFTKNYDDSTHTPIPGETSWLDNDSWTVDDPDPENPPVYNGKSTVNVQCIVNENPSGTWTLGVMGEKLDNGTYDIPFTYKVNEGEPDEKEYAYYGWVPSIVNGNGELPSDGHKYTYDDAMKPYSATESETAYTSADGETGSTINIWTGMQIPISQPASNGYSSMVTYTLTK
jgi:hypothetical protein